MTTPQVEVVSELPATIDYIEHVEDLTDLVTVSDLVVVGVVADVRRGPVLGEVDTLEGGVIEDLRERRRHVTVRVDEAIAGVPATEQIVVVTYGWARIDGRWVQESPPNGIRLAAGNRVLLALGRECREPGPVHSEMNDQSVYVLVGEEVVDTVRSVPARAPCRGVARACAAVTATHDRRTVTYTRAGCPSGLERGLR